MNVITWNVQWCRGVDGTVDPARIARVARALADFDVLCLQEVAINFPGLAGSRGENQMAELSAALPGYLQLFGVATDLDDGRGGRSQFGNAIFTRFPCSRYSGISCLGRQTRACRACSGWRWKPSWSRLEARSA